MSDKTFKAAHFKDINYIHTTKEEDSSYFLDSENIELLTPIELDSDNFYSNPVANSSSETLPNNEFTFSNFIPNSFIFPKNNHNKSATIGNWIPQHDTCPKSFQPVTSASYSGYKKTEAVSYLSYFAETTANNLKAVSLDSEGV